MADRRVEQSYYRFFIPVLVVLCAGIVTYGLAKQTWPTILPWVEYKDFGVFVLLLAGLMLISWGLLSKTGNNPLVIWGGIAFLLAISTRNVWPSLACIWITLAWIALGRSFLVKAGCREAAEDLLLTVVTGAGLMGSVLNIAASLPVHYYGVYALFFSIPIACERKYLTCKLHELVKQREWQSSGQEFLTASIFALSFFHIVISFLPEMGFDALAIHLFIPTQVVQQHQLVFRPDIYVWTLMPMLGDWLYTAGYMVAGETCARLLNVIFIFITALICCRFVLWAGGTKRGCKWSVLLFLSTPIVFTESSSLFIDSIWSTFILGAAVVFFRLASCQMRLNEGMIIGGLFLGCAASAKAVTLPNLPLFILLIVFSFRHRSLWTVIKAVSLGAGIFLLVGTIPYLRAWWIAGNPVFPFFNGIFNSPFYPPVNFNNPLFTTSINWRILYDLLFDSSKYLEATVGACGFQWMLLLIPVIGVLILQKKCRALALLGFGVGLVVLTFLSQSYLRYVFPSFALISAVIGVGLSVEGRLLAATAVSAFGLNLLFFTSGTLTYRQLPLLSLFVSPERNEYINQQLPIRKAVEMVNVLNIHSSPVAFLSQPFAAGLSADALFPNWYNRTFQSGILSAKTPEELAEVLSRHGVQWVVFDSNWGSILQQELIKKITREVFRLGTIHIRTMKVEYLYSLELLGNSGGLDQGYWYFSSGVLYDPKDKTCLVTVAENATQLVPVKGGRWYFNSVTARCDNQSAQGRVQVNWLDKNNQFISTNIRVFDCKNDWNDYGMEIRAPKEAQSAMVYMSGHNSHPVEFKHVSFRQ